MDVGHLSECHNNFEFDYSGNTLHYIWSEQDIASDTNTQEGRIDTWRVYAYSMICF